MRPWEHFHFDYPEVFLARGDSDLVLGYMVTFVLKNGCREEYLYLHTEDPSVFPLQNEELDRLGEEYASTMGFEKYVGHSSGWVGGAR